LKGTSVVAADNQHGAFRAAGQVVAALSEGALIESVSVTGIALTYDEGPPRSARRCDILADIAVALAGIATEDRYRFGTPPPEERGRMPVCAHWSFNARQLADFVIVQEFIAAIDPDDEQDLLLQAWTQALSFVRDEATWEEIELLAVLIAKSALDGAEIQRLFPEAPFGLKGRPVG
jgi:hypothetical protein